MEVKDMQAVVKVQRYDSPCGVLMLGSFEDKLCLCDWLQSKHFGRNIERLKKAYNASIVVSSSSAIDKAAMQLDEYFSGQRREFDVDILCVGTDFQKSVWQQLMEIPFGMSLSYRELALRLGKQNSVRAVANAVGANPLSLFIPCHRVIGANRSLTGYAGGRDAKRYLLQLEYVDFVE